MDNTLLRLVTHTTQGYTEDVHAAACSLGYKRFLESQLDPESIDDKAAQPFLQTLHTLEMSGPELYALYGQGNDHVPVTQLRTAMLHRSISSARQLLERVVEFWTDHFNIYQTDTRLRLLKTIDDREVVRRHALGKFPDMLAASARSSAMLRYLDNDSNVAGAPNENYARELMELHTLGVDGPYTQNDVREVARCFTGWTVDFTPSNWGAFRFEPSRHDFGAKTVFGVTIPAGGGMSDAEFVLDHIGRHRSTACFVGRKLTAWILGYDPPEALVQRVEDTYVATGGDVVAMLRVILARDVLAAAVPFDTRKHKRPYHFIVSLLRQTRARITDFGPLQNELRHMGQAPYDWAPPDGYPDTVDAWGSSVLDRWEFADRLLNGQIAGISISPATIQALHQGVPRERIAARLSAFMTGGTMPAAAVQRIQSYADSLPAYDDAALRSLIALAASSPSYQYY